MTILTDKEINEILMGGNLSPCTEFNSDHDDFLPLYIDPSDSSFGNNLFLQQMEKEIA